VGRHHDELDSGRNAPGVGSSADSRKRLGHPGVREVGSRRHGAPPPLVIKKKRITEREERLTLHIYRNHLKV
jgi:hypothetical protein